MDCYFSIPIPDCTLCFGYSLEAWITVNSKPFAVSPAEEMAGIWPIFTGCQQTEKPVAKESRKLGESEAQVMYYAPGSAPLSARLP